MKTIVYEKMTRSKKKNLIIYNLREEREGTTTEKNESDKKERLVFSFAIINKL